MNEMSLASKVLLAFTIPLALAYTFLVIPQMKATSQVLADIDALRETSTPAATAKQKEEFKQKLLAARAEANKLLPPTDEQYDLSVQVENLAKTNNLVISGLSVNAAQPTNLPKTTAPTGDVPTSSADASRTFAEVAAAPGTALKVTVTVGVQGAYADVQRFVTRLPALDRFIQIDQLSLSSGSSTINAQVTAQAYYLPATR